MFQKIARIEDPDFIEWIKSLKCLVNARHMGQTVHHHVNKKGHGSMGSKTDDRRCIPLCVLHHNEVHQIGAKTFALKYELDYEIVIEALNRLYEEE